MLKIYQITHTSRTYPPNRSNLPVFVTIWLLSLRRCVNFSLHLICIFILEVLRVFWYDIFAFDWGKIKSGRVFEA